MNEQTLSAARAIIASFLRDRREELCLTQVELAEKTGLGVATIKRLEQGRFWPGLKQYLIICEALCLFPLISTFEGSDDMSRVMRESWTQKQEKDMTIEEALALKEGRHFRPGAEN